MGVTIIEASRWERREGVPDNELQPNHGCNLSTDGIMESLHEIESRPEMAQLDELLMASGAYLRGKDRG